MATPFSSSRPAASESAPSWLAGGQTRSADRTFFVYDIRIDEGQRGRGYGRAAMIAAEAEAARRGIDRMALNVFGGNKRARSLYHSLGYTERAVTMDKTLTREI